MGWRVRKSVNLGRGVRLNLSRSGIGVSAGVKGLRFSTGPRGSRITASIPGTGISYQSRLGGKKSRRRARPALTAQETTAPVTSLPRKSLAVAYLLWLPLGLLGAHRYYLGKTSTAVAQTLTLGGLGLWWLLDLFLIPQMVDQANRGTR